MHHELTLGPLSVQHVANWYKTHYQYFPTMNGGPIFYMPVVVIYMDNAIVLGYTEFGTYLVDATEVLQQLQNAGMQVNTGKCLWFQPAVT
jgi:hypothetical protein